MASGPEDDKVPLEWALEHSRELRKQGWELRKHGVLLLECAPGSNGSEYQAAVKPEGSGFGLVRVEVGAVWSGSGAV